MRPDPPHPGEIVKYECLDPLGLSVTAAAKGLGVTRQALSELVNGHAGVSVDMPFACPRPSAPVPKHGYGCNRPMIYGRRVSAWTRSRSSGSWWREAIVVTEMSKDAQLRRALQLCVHFTRNLAYYEAGDTWRQNQPSDFWLTVDGNFLDIAVLEWCKIFGDERNSKNHWNKIIRDHEYFKEKLLYSIDIDKNEFDSYIKELRKYRDKFVAHLDSHNNMDIPKLDKARKTVDFYHKYILDNEVNALDMHPWDLKRSNLDLHSYFVDEKQNARRIYNAMEK